METGQENRDDFLEVAKKRLDAWEVAQISFIQSTFDSPTLQKGIRFLQRTIGVSWIRGCTKHLRHVHGLERLPEFEPDKSYVFVTNHRSFFDQYTITADLMQRGLKHRIVFPVRANFFYDSFAGFLVNGSMSFFAMYPPIFRDKKKAFVNVASLSELARLIRRGGMFVGLHPEGTRNTGPDPYQLLPAQPGVGRVVFEARTTVVPVFINGLINDFGRQIVSNFDGSGTPIHIVFGSPIDFSDLFEQRRSPRVYRAISERCMEHIAVLGEEERAIRQTASQS